jgi:hypothetical protein
LFCLLNEFSHNVNKTLYFLDFNIAFSLSHTISSFFFLFYKSYEGNTRYIYFFTFLILNITYLVYFYRMFFVYLF